MQKYKVKIFEEYLTTIEIEASSPENAEDIARVRYFSGLYSDSDRELSNVDCEVEEVSDAEV